MDARMNYGSGALAFFFFVYIVVPLLLILGWIMNLSKLWVLVHGPLNNEFILRAIGGFIAPFGGIIGWF